MNVIIPQEGGEGLGFPSMPSLGIKDRFNKFTGVTAAQEQAAQAEAAQRAAQEQAAQAEAARKAAELAQQQLAAQAQQDAQARAAAEAAAKQAADEAANVRAQSADLLNSPTAQKYIELDKRTADANNATAKGEQLVAEGEQKKAEGEAMKQSAMNELNAIDVERGQIGGPTQTFARGSTLATLGTAGQAVTGAIGTAGEAFNGAIGTATDALGEGVNKLAQNMPGVGALTTVGSSFTNLGSNLGLGSLIGQKGGNKMYQLQNKEITRKRRVKSKRSTKKPKQVKKRRTRKSKK
jgi:chemotaxis protein histidine kinase CheA